MVSPRRDPGRPTANVAESWRRIEAWLGEHLPAVRASLRDGVTKRDLNKFEKALERPLPEDVRESWLIHDGQGPIPDEFYGTVKGRVPESLGILYGYDLNPLTSKRGLAPKSVLGEWSWEWSGPTVYPITKERRVLAPKPVLDWSAWEKPAAKKGKSADRDDLGEGRPSFPADAIRHSWVHPGWLPLATLVDSDFLGVDLAPGPRGVVGQVITYGRHSYVRHVLAASWAQFLEDFADELEAGNFDIDMRRTFDEFRMREPGRFGVNAQAWSEAKLPPTFGAGVERRPGTPGSSNAGGRDGRRRRGDPRSR
jgi:cell wall assembly regulator SMI1